MTELAGYLGALMLGACALPQMIQCIREGHGKGLNWGFLALWYGGELTMLVHIWHLGSWQLVANYLANIVMISVIIYYKVLPRR